MYMYSSLRTRKKTVDDLLQAVSVLKDDLHRQEAKNASLDEKLQNFGNEMNSTFDSLFKSLNVDFAKSGTAVTPLSRARTQSGGSASGLTRGRTMSAGALNSARDRTSSTGNGEEMSIQAFARSQQQQQQRYSGMSDSLSSLRPLSAGSPPGQRPKLQRTNTSGGGGGSSPPPRTSSDIKPRNDDVYPLTPSLVSTPATPSSIKGRRNSGGKVAFVSTA
jgi:hypothetical protein